jgi:hypothetical protein
MLVTKYAKSHFVLRMLHPSSALSCERLEILHPSAVAVCRMILDAHKPVVAELEHAIREHGTDATADDITQSPPFSGKCGDNRPFVGH